MTRLTAAILTLLALASGPSLAQETEAPAPCDETSGSTVDCTVTDGAGGAGLNLEP